MLNKITIMGSLTSDPTLRYTNSQIPVASFTIACDRDVKEKDSNNYPVDFINCVAWRGTGEFVNNYFSKGMMAAVDGRLQMRNWTDKEGSKRTTAEILVEHVYFCEKKRSEEASGSVDFEPVEDDGELPFL